MVVQAGIYVRTYALSCFMLFFMSIVIVNNSVAVHVMQVKGKEQQMQKQKHFEGENSEKTEKLSKT